MSASGPSTVETLLIALAGGAIGALLTGLAWIGARLLSVLGDLDRHDFEAAVLNQDLELWAADDYRKIKQELTAIENRAANNGQLYSGSYGSARAGAKTKALHRWRDRLHHTERRLVAIRAEEGWLHRLHRRRERYQHGLDLTAPARVEPIIEELRQPVTKHGQPSISVFDPTRFKLGVLLEAIEQNPLEPRVPPRVEEVPNGAGGRDRTIHDKPRRETPDIQGLSGPTEDGESESNGRLK